MSWLPSSLALLAHPGNDAEIGSLARRTAVALVRAALGQRRRVLVHSDPGTLLAVAMVAAELSPLATVEGPGEAPPPLIVLPPVRDEAYSAEDGIFDIFDTEDRHADEPVTLLDLLAATGVFELGQMAVARDQQLTGGLFAELFQRWQPRDIVAVGPPRLLRAAIEGAETFREQSSRVRLFFAEGVSRSESWGWPSLESLLRGRELDVPPTFLGEPINEEIAGLARQATLEAHLALAVERVATGEAEDFILR